MRQNLTVSLDKALLQKLRVIAAERSTSISRLVAEELEGIVEQSERFENARRRALQDLEAGYRLGGQSASRDALHDREALR